MEATLSFLAHGGWGWGWIFPLFWILVIGLFVWRGPWRWRRHAHWHDPRSAAEVLGERYARGEIDEQEYRQRLAVLREGR